MLKLRGSVVSKSVGYALRVNATETVGEIARYLSQQDTYIDQNTLERAIPLEPAQLLQDVNIRLGDRLVILTSKIQSGRLPPLLRPGDKLLKFSNSDYEIQSQGKRELYVGRPDPNGTFTPDIDLRNFVLPDHVAQISRQTLHMTYDDNSRMWTVKNVGRARVFTDEFELRPNSALQLDQERIFRFYPGNMSSISDLQRQAIGQMRVSTEEVKFEAGRVELDRGEQQVRVIVGTESDALELRASQNLPLSELAQRVSSYVASQHFQEFEIYLLQVVAPGLAVGTLSGTPLFYAAQQTAFSQNVLLLTNTQRTSQRFQFLAGREEKAFLIGRRTDAQEPESQLALDLYEVLENGPNADQYRSISRQQAEVRYRDDAWLMSLSERSQTPVFINNYRLTGGSEVQLASGDVLSFGPTVDQYLVRLEVDISVKHQ